MKHNASYKQFAKDCPTHFSEDVLKNGSLKEPIQHNTVKKVKSTFNSKIPNKF